MQTFAEFLAEGVAFSASSFPALAASGSSPVEQAYVNRTLQKLLDAINAVDGPVPNPRFKEMKFTFGSLLDRALNPPSWVLDLMRTPSFDSWDYDIANANGLAGKIKKAEAALATFPSVSNPAKYLQWWLPIARELLTIHQTLESIKAGVFKRQPKAPEDVQAKYVAPLAKLSSGKVVMDTLREVTERLKGDYAKAVSGWILGRAEAYAAMTAPQQEANRKRYSDVLTYVSKLRGRGYAQGVDLQPDYKAKIKLAGERAAEDMQQAFVVKNAKKLVAILEAKGIALKGTPKILNLRAGNGTYEGEIRLTFKDGSAFTVRNKVVLKINAYNTVFNQFPTTFHDVVMPDGSPLRGPSEERMNTVFTKG